MNLIINLNLKMNANQVVSSLSERVKSRFWCPRSKVEIIQQIKHAYGQNDGDVNENSMIFKLVCNSLARVSTPLFITSKSKGKEGPGCIAINLDFSIAEEDPLRLKLNKINFASKREIEKSKVRIDKSLQYCFGRTDQILDENMKKDLTRKLNDFLPSFNTAIGINYKSVSRMDDKALLDFLTEMFQSDEVIQSIINEEDLDSKEQMIKKFNYVLMIYNDLIVLPDIFKRYFIEPTNLESILNPIYNPSNIKNIHPDALLASVIFQQQCRCNNYIGTTFLCCIYCSIYLDCYSFEFSGTSGEFEFTWQMPPEFGDTKHYKNFVTDINMLKLQIERNQPPFRTAFRNHHPIHWCRRAAGKMSNDISLYKEYYGLMAKKVIKI